MPRNTVVSTHDVLDVLGPTVEFLTDPLERGLQYCVIKGTIPPGVPVPLHSHRDPETFYVVSGSVQTRVGDRDWQTVTSGQCLHIPGQVKHAHRNVTDQPVVEIVVTTPSLGRFFSEVGRHAAQGTAVPPSPRDLARFAEIADKYGHWLASPAENEAIGIHLPG